MAKSKKKICNIDWKAYEEYLREHGKGRAKNVGWKSLDNEIDFMMGGHVIMGFCGEMNKMPADVVFGYMGDRSALGLDKQYEYYERKKKGRR